MAVITLNATYRKVRLWQQLETMLFACREMLDAFVTTRMQHAVAKAEQAGPRRRQGTPPNWPTDQAETPAVQLGPLDPNVLSETIPAFYVGRNMAGLWVAREANGRVGGIFLLKNSALSFARAQSGAGGCATIFPLERFELDLENEGNPFAVHLAALIQFAVGLWGWVGMDRASHRARRKKFPRSLS
jgi:hypothetical protein